MGQPTRRSLTNVFHFLSEIKEHWTFPTSVGWAFLWKQNLHATTWVYAWRCFKSIQTDAHVWCSQMQAEWRARTKRWDAVAILNIIEKFTENELLIQNCIIGHVQLLQNISSIVQTSTVAITINKEPLWRSRENDWIRCDRYKHKRGRKGVLPISFRRSICRTRILRTSSRLHDVRVSFLSFVYFQYIFLPDHEWDSCTRFPSFTLYLLREVLSFSVLFFFLFRLVRTVVSSSGREWFAPGRSA